MSQRFDSEEQYVYVIIDQHLIPNDGKTRGHLGTLALNSSTGQILSRIQVTTVLANDCGA